MGCFVIVEASAVEGRQLHRSLFLDLIKPVDTKRSRLCVVACHDNDHGLLTAALNIKRLIIRLVFTLCATDKLNVYSHDRTKAFVLCKTNLRRPVFRQAPKEMKLDKELIPEMWKNLYGTPEIPVLWFKTYSDYHVHNLKMTPTTLDPCLFCRRGKSTIDGIIGVRVDTPYVLPLHQFLTRRMWLQMSFQIRERSL